MRNWLIGFRQNEDSNFNLMLIYSHTYKDAVAKIIAKYPNACNILNQTIE